jgi:hypothetical protein
MNAFDVLKGKRGWSAERADALAWLRSLPSGCVDLVFFSPPYEDARRYAENRFSLQGQAWVDWLRPIIVECARVSKGLVAVNMAAKVTLGSYTAAVEWLVADLTREDGLFCGPSPYCWIKSEDDPEAPGNGQPGSGAKHYHRRDWEPIYAFAEPGKLPGRGAHFWSDQKAYGKPPKYRAGGAPSHRDKNGVRANARGAIKHTKRGPDGMVDQVYLPPAISNPGNILNLGNVVRAALQLREIISYGYADQASPKEVLLSLREATEAQAVHGWGAGVSARLLAASILQPDLHGARRADATAATLRLLQAVLPASEFGSVQASLLLASLPDGGADEEPGRGGCQGPGEVRGQEDHDAEAVLDVRRGKGSRRSPQGRQPAQQREVESPSPLPQVPRTTPQPGAAVEAGLLRLWKNAGQELQEIWRLVRQALPALQDARERVYGSGAWTEWAPRPEAASDVIRVPVGGGKLGCPIAHEGEAPMALGVAERLGRWFVPVGGIVADPFVGTGTTIHAARLHKRLAIGCDNRQSQVDLTCRRMAKVLPGVVLPKGAL